MKYVKLIAKPDTWFKSGIEVFHYDEDRRMTLDEWNEWLKSGIVLARGIRVCEDNDNERGNGWKPGFEREDGECCTCDEFEVEIIEE